MIDKVIEQPEYSIYTGMKQRCNNKNYKYYHRYGGRGIKVCDRWARYRGFWNFIDDMGRRPSQQHTLDRINGDGDYEPSNCKWSTMREQCSHRCVRVDNKVGVSGINFSTVHNRWVVRTTVDGKRKCLGYFRELDDAKASLASYDR